RGWSVRQSTVFGVDRRVRGRFRLSLFLLWCFPALWNVVVGAVPAALQEFVLHSVEERVDLAFVVTSFTDEWACELDVVHLGRGEIIRVAQRARGAAQ